MNSSGSCVARHERNSGRSTSRPTVTISTIAERRLARAPAAARGEPRRSPRAEDADGEQHRRHGQVLEQQHREGGAAGRRVQPLLLRQHRHHDRGRGQRQRQADERRPAARLGPSDRPTRRAPPAQTTTCRAPEAEHEPPHRPQPLPGELEADHEQQEDDAELGEMRDLRRVADGDPVEPRRPATRRAQAEGPSRAPAPRKPSTGLILQAQEQRHHDAGGGEEEDHLLVGFGRCGAAMSFHRAVEGRQCGTATARSSCNFVITGLVPAISIRKRRAVASGWPGQARPSARDQSDLRERLREIGDDVVGCSMPIETRMVASVMPRRSRISFGTPEWSWWPGWQASDSVPPRLTASLKTCSAFRTAERLGLAAPHVEREGRAGAGALALEDPPLGDALRQEGRIVDRATRGCPARKRATISALRQAAVMRSDSVSSERAEHPARMRVELRADGAAQQPDRLRHGLARPTPRRRRGRSGRRHIWSASRPTMSAPCCSGFWKIGPSSVLSQTIIGRRPLPRADLVGDAPHQRRCRPGVFSGLEGVSIKITETRPLRAGAPRPRRGSTASSTPSAKPSRLDAERVQRLGEQRLGAAVERLAVQDRRRPAGRRRAASWRSPTCRWRRRSPVSAPSKIGQAILDDLAVRVVEAGIDEAGRRRPPAACGARRRSRRSRLPSSAVRNTKVEVRNTGGLTAPSDSAGS